MGLFTTSYLYVLIYSGILGMPLAHFAFVYRVCAISEKWSHTEVVWRRESLFHGNYEGVWQKPKAVLSKKR